MMKRIFLISLLLGSIFFITASTSTSQPEVPADITDSQIIERILSHTDESSVATPTPVLEGLKSGYFVESEATGPHNEPGMECYLGFSRVAAFTSTGIYIIGSKSVAYSEFTSTTGIKPVGIGALPTLFTDFGSSRAGLTTFSSILYDDLWPGIDLTYSMTPAGLKYEYSISDGAHLEWLGLQIEGQEVELTDGDKTLIVNGIEDTGLVAWADSGRPVDVRFSLSGDTLRFITLEPYVGGLTIDPLIYSSFLGGSGPDEAVSVAVDENGSAYVTGWAESSDFPTVPGSYDVTYNNLDTFICKFAPNGTYLEYSTYYGLTGTSTYPGDIAVYNGSAFIVGSTNNDIPTTAISFNTTYNGGTSDAFVARLSPNGTTLEFSTYFGGWKQDYGRGIGIGENGNVYITGDTFSALPTTPGAPQAGPGGNEDAFIAKITYDGSTLLNCTHLGGTEKDIGESIAIDGNGTAYVVGWSKSSDFPTTRNAYNDTFGGDVDVFLTRASANGTTWETSTFVGGSDREFAYDIVLENRTSHLTGSTKSGNWPITADAFQVQFNNHPAPPSNYDAFYLAMDWNGTLIYNTFLGGYYADYGYSITISEAGLVCIGGMSESSDFPTVFGSQDVSFGGGQDAFMVEFSLDASTLLYGTFMGNSGDESGDGVAIDTNGSVYLTGWTDSSAFTTTTGTLDESYNGGPNDGFISKFNLSALAWPNIRLLSATTLADLSEYFTVNANITDNRPGGAGVAWVNLTFDGDEYSMSNTSTPEAWNWTVSLLMNSSHASRLIYWNIWAGVVDGFTNSTQSYNISVGNIPNIHNVSADSSKTQNSVWRVQTIVSDDRTGDSGVSSVRVLFDDQYYDMTSGSETYIWSHTLGDTGTFEWRIIVTDVAGNTNSSEIFELRVRGAPGVSAVADDEPEPEAEIPTLPEAPSVLWQTGWYLWVLLMAALAILSAYGYTSTKTKPKHWKAFLGFSVMFVVVGGAVMGLMGALSWLLTIGVWSLVGGASFFVASFKMKGRIRQTIKVRWLGAIVCIVLAGVLATLGLVGVI